MLWVLVALPAGSVGGGGEPAEGLVGPVVVVLGSPVLEDHLGFEDVGEVVGVEAFVSQASTATRTKARDEMRSAPTDRPNLRAACGYDPVEPVSGTDVL